ncbi:hypothetical protein F4808DRAFT_414429 [Astrocystis sublimbata]|nr:hypothetical protein F4808DRAFT_414429 [Astrocystis sublimbata]
MSFLDDKRRAGGASQSENQVRGQPIAPASSNSSLSSGLPITDDTQNYNNGFLPESPGLVTEEDVPPAYSEFHDQLNIHQTGFDAGITVTDDGRVNININQTSRQLADFIAPALRRQLEQGNLPSSEAVLPPAYIPPSLGGQPGQTPPPRLNVVIQIVGSRGDVQPFIALGQVLRDTYGHRVRVATHATFQKFVEENGLEFFAIGGDPAELMAFMVKHPGLMPGIDALKNGEITKRRKGIEEIVMGCWRACIETGDGLGPAPKYSRGDEHVQFNATPVAGTSQHKPFVADVIIANPPSFAHIHVAEKLGIPVHLMFTMPWSPTRAFPQPLANVQSSNTDPVTTNYLTYAMVEMMTWQGLGDIINRFRTKILDLDPLPLIWAPGVITRLRIPYTYCWSPALIPKPQDWGNHIDIAGFYFLNLASSYTPDPDLAAFLAAGPPPVYIGFGSIVVDDPNKLTRMIFDAVAETGVRALVSKGWGGLGADSVGIPDGVFMLGNVPHDWLFKNVSAVCHHGGAGTTAAGIQAGKPTIVVPFFGDQPFWGAMVARAGAGPDPIPFKKLTAAGLAEAIKIAIKPETQQKAKELGEKIREEKGADLGAHSFHKHLNVDQLRCDVAPSRVAVWRVRRSETSLSALAAATLVNNGYLKYSDLKLFRAKEYDTDSHPTDPISACASALIGDISSIAMSAADFPRDLFKTSKGPKVKENPAAAGTASESAKNTESTKDASQPKDSDSASVLSKGNSSVSNLTGTTAETSTPSAPRQQQIAPPVETDTDMNAQLEKILDTSRNINNIVTTGVKTPMNFCLGLAKGFRGAPSLYNDDTVRRAPEKVTNLSSGLRVAGKEFGYGFLDGITGLVTQPLKGAEKEGGAGLVKGFAKGIGGLILKPAAGVWGLPGYAMAGVHAEIRGMFSQSAHKYVAASRIAQGNQDFNESTAEEREDIEVRWLSMRDKLKGFNALKQKQKGKARDASPSAQGQISSTTDSSNVGATQKRSLQDRKREWMNSRAKGQSGAQIVQPGSTNDTNDLDNEFETAIQAAVRETSTGNSVEDARIEQVIRSSVRAMREQAATEASAAPPSVNHSNDRWVSDVKQPYSDEKGGSTADLENITDEEYQALIEKAIQQSVAGGPQHAITMRDLEGSDEESDEETKRALAASQGEQQQAGTAFDEDAIRQAIEASKAEQQQPDGEEEFERALAESQKAHQQELERRQAEEDAMMELAKKHSLSHADQGNSSNDHVEEEDLRRALEESMRTDDAVQRGGGGGPSGA